MAAKLSAAVALLGVATAMTVAVHAADTYPESQDRVDIDQFLGDDQKVGEYFKCLMETGPCSQKGEAIKRELTYNI